VSFKRPETNPISIEELRKQAEQKSLMKYDEIVVVARSKYAEIVRRVFEGEEGYSSLEGA